MPLSKLPTPRETKIFEAIAKAELDRGQFD
jgi:hypothetical protein